MRPVYAFREASCYSGVAENSMIVRFKPVLFTAVFVPLYVLNMPAQDTWDRVRALATGTEVLVAPNRPGNTRGRVDAVTSDSILVKSGKGQETFLRGKIAWISVREGRRKKHVVSGLKWGAVIGAGLGALVGSLCNHGNAGCFAAVIAIGSAEVAGMGALLGAVRPAGEWREIYRE